MLTRIHPLDLCDSCCREPYPPGTNIYGTPWKVALSIACIARGSEDNRRLLWEHSAVSLLEAALLQMVSSNPQTSHSHSFLLSPPTFTHACSPSVSPVVLLLLPLPSKSAHPAELHAFSCYRQVQREEGEQALTQKHVIYALRALMLRPQQGSEGDIQGLPELTKRKLIGVAKVHLHPWRMSVRSVQLIVHGWVEGM